MKQILTSESVSEAHPDKLCDQISDAILDAHLEQDPLTRAGIEVLSKTNMVVVAGEVSSKGRVDIGHEVHSVIDRIGYTPAAHRASFGTDPGQIQHMDLTVQQSPDISMGVDGHGLDDQGAGDQGMMFGYASNETPSLMPAPVALAHQLTRATTDARRDGRIEGLRPDSKSMVSMAYEDGIPQRVVNVLISAQHDEDVDLADFAKAVEEMVHATIPGDLMDDAMTVMVNPTGKFALGGPLADAGLTGRKIIADTYGGIGRHGGGAFSGKDPSKVDRSAAYAMRWVAKNVVASGAASRCEVQVSYAIGVAAPVSLMVETFGTATVDPDRISTTVQELFDLRPAAIIQDLDLLRPIYKKTAAYGHFGREDDPDFTWESTSRASDLARALGL